MLIKIEMNHKLCFTKQG